MHFEYQLGACRMRYVCTDRSMSILSLLGYFKILVSQNETMSLVVVFPPFKGSGVVRYDFFPEML